MHLNNYQYLKNKERYLLIFLFLFSLSTRIPIIFILGDTNLENEWEFLVKHLVDHGQLYSILPYLLGFGDFLVPNVLCLLFTLTIYIFLNSLALLMKYTF